MANYWKTYACTFMTVLCIWYLLKRGTNKSVTLPHRNYTDKDVQFVTQVGVFPTGYIYVHIT